MNSDITFPAVGDGCFYVGLGGQKQYPANPSFQPYQCCPSKSKVGTKVPKISATNTKHDSHKQSQLNPKPLTTVRKDSKTTAKSIQSKPVAKPTSTKPSSKTPTKENEGTKGKAAGNAKPQDKGKGKKSFFGTGKYIWWW